MAVMTGERRVVSVLFADIVNSTGIGEKLGPERSKFLFDEVVRLMGAQVVRFGGTVAQQIGDEVYAVFGAPLSHEDDSERAVHAALAIQKALAEYSEEVEAAYGVGLSARVGINTGPVVIDTDSEDPYNALGDTVNVAARIQELAGPGGIVVGPETRVQVEGCFQLEELPEQELRGKSAPMKTFRVVGTLEYPAVLPTRPLVGRDFELTVVERAMDGLVEGRGAIVSIMGEAGIGKTRLVLEVEKDYGDRVRFLEGRAVSYAETFPYWPVRELLREWLEVGASTPEARVRLELKARLAETMGKQAPDAYPLVAGLAGLTLEPDAAARIGDLSRESLQHQTFEVFADLVWYLAEERPLCLVFEDLHWADDSTLQLLERLLRVTEEASVALFLLYRSEREHGSWQLGARARQRYPHRYREIELRPLPLDASRALAGTVAEGDLPEYVAELLAERAGGNPFFLEEAVRDLIERGALHREEGRWILGVREDELTIPALVQGALQARLDRLDVDAREVVSVAAVIGRTFGMPLLEQLVPYERLIGALSELQRLDLVVEKRRRPTPEFRFRHGIVQEVAYASLVETQRRRLHLATGEALERIYVESPEEAFGLLARHFSEAGERERAVEYLLKAGDAARAIYADQEAIGHYSKARDYLVAMGDELRARDTLFKMALVHHLAFDFARAEMAYDEAFCCRVPDSQRLEQTERIETAIEFRFQDLVPGGSYTTEGVMLTEHLFRGLLTLDRDLNVLPDMADNFRVSNDGLTYLFRLREGIRWSDGVPVTAEDFAYTWKRMRDGESVTAFLLEDVDSASALDDRTLEVRLREPRSYFPYVLASAWSFPWPRHKCVELGDAWRDPAHLVSNGPFVLAELTADYALLSANPHWDGPHGNVREIRVALGASHAELAEHWRQGEFDLLQSVDPSLEEATDTLAEVVPAPATYYVAYRAYAPPFSNVLVRKAFSHALDRQAVTAAVSPLARPATRGGAIPPAIPGHSHRLAPEYDLELARSLLAQAGYPEGKGLPELEFLVPSWVQDPSIFLEQWGALGAHLSLRREQMYALTEIPSSVHLWVHGFAVDYPDPDGFFHGFLRADAPSFLQDDEIVEMADRARSLRDQNERMHLYHEIDRLFVAERAAILPLFYGRTLLVRRPWVENLWANPMSGAHLDQVVVTRPAGS